MKWNFRSWPAIAAATISVFAASGTAVAGQRTAAEPVAAHQGMVSDWSTHAHVYSNPDTPDDAARKGRTAQWHRDYQDPRFVLSLMRKLEAQASPLVPSTTSNAAAANRPAPRPGRKPESMHRDWSAILGGSTDGLGGRAISGLYPAKYSFDINATPSCANDFVVFATNAAGANAVPTSFETRVSTFTGLPTNGQTVIIGTAGTARTVTLTAAATNTGATFLSTGTIATVTTNLAAAVNRWTGTTGISATATPVISPTTVTFGRTTHGNTVLIPITETLGNYTVAAADVDGAGTPGQATIVGYNNLYAGTCGATVPFYPTTLWAYNTGTGKIVETSPVLSYYDGAKQVAFIQRDTTPNPDTLELVLLKPAAGAGTVQVPTVPTAVTNANYRTCTAPCMTTFVLSGTTTTSVTTFSSPYINYSGDVLWVGDGNGALHKFTGVFSGASPAEVTTGGFPKVLSVGNALSPPVYDGGTGMVFVGSDAGAATGGILHKVNAATGVAIDSARLAAFNTAGVLASPVLDTSAQRVYAVVFDDDSDNDAVPPATCNGGNTPPCKALYQFTTAFVAANKGTRAQIGHGNTGSATRAQFGGTFDDAYYINPTPTGSIYICGSDNNTTSIATLWKIPITNNVLGTPVEGAALTTNGTVGNCSPVAEVKNGTHEYLYVSIQDNANQALCTIDCLFMFDLTDLNGAAAGTGAAWGTTNVPTAAIKAYGGTGGIIVDNISGTAGASQVYFSNIGVAAAPYGNATQASQAGLQ